MGLSIRLNRLGLIVTLAHLAPFLGSWNYSQICGRQQWRYGDRSLHRFNSVAECDGQTGRVTDTHSKTDASTTAEMHEALHTVAREKSCAVLNFARFDSLVCSVARSREKSRSLSLVPFLACYRSLSLALALAYRSMHKPIYRQQARREGGVGG